MALVTQQPNTGAISTEDKDNLELIKALRELKASKDQSGTIEGGGRMSKNGKVDVLGKTLTGLVAAMGKNPKMMEGAQKWFSDFKNSQSAAPVEDRSSQLPAPVSQGALDAVPQAPVDDRSTQMPTNPYDQNPYATEDTGAVQAYPVQEPQVQENALQDEWLKQQQLASQGANMFGAGTAAAGGMFGSGYGVGGNN